MKDKVSQKNHGVLRRTVGNELLSSRFKRGILPCSALGLLVAVIIGVLLAILISWIICHTDDPARYVTPAALTTLYVAAFIGGVTSTLLNKKSALLCGLAVGGMLVAVMFAVSLPINESFSENHDVISAIALRAAVPISSTLGAFVGVTKKTSNKKRGKNYKKR